MTHIQKLIDVKKTNSFDECIKIAIDRFVENFDFKIRQLLHNFPADYVNPDGSKFWSGSKRAPQVISYDSSNDLHLLFVDSYARIIAEALGIKVDEKHNSSYTRNVSSKIIIPQFQPKKVFIKANENDTISGDFEDVEKEEVKKISVLMNQLSLCDKNLLNPTHFKPTEFEKDDDTNHHIDFIHAASNLRANNYRIAEVIKSY